MEEHKVTSYELSKQLHDAGFECNNHTGFHSATYSTRKYKTKDSCSYPAPRIQYHSTKKSKLYNYLDVGIKRLFSAYTCLYKAYSCYDLLVYLQQNDIRVEAVLYKLDQPQNALAKAILKVNGDEIHGKQLRITNPLPALGCFACLGF